MKGRYAKKFLPIPADNKRTQFILSSSKERIIKEKAKTCGKEETDNRVAEKGN